MSPMSRNTRFPLRVPPDCRPCRLCQPSRSVPILPHSLPTLLQSLLSARPATHRARDTAPHPTQTRQQKRSALLHWSRSPPIGASGASRGHACDVTVISTGAGEALTGTVGCCWWGASRGAYASLAMVGNGRCSPGPLVTAGFLLDRAVSVWYVHHQLASIFHFLIYFTIAMAGCMVFETSLGAGGSGWQFPHTLTPTGAELEELMAFVQWAFPDTCSGARWERQEMKERLREREAAPMTRTVLTGQSAFESKVQSVQERARKMTASRDKRIAGDDEDRTPPTRAIKKMRITDPGRISSARTTRTAPDRKGSSDDKS
ncbi:hypothetical protein C8R47DRAFT_1070552 [Mycena vitilis]|nr:hypothetical protein C8R47DRAFT_1070552 [Mycena vitilis]